MKETTRRINGESVLVHEEVKRNKETKTTYTYLRERITGDRQWHRVRHITRKGVVIDTKWRSTKEEATKLFNNRMAVASMYQQAEMFDD